jgi:hypothetical protein
MTMSPTKRAFAAAIAVSVLLTALIALLDPLLDAFPHPPDQGPWWYYWRLTEPTVWTRLSAWIGYALHQASIWIVVILMMKEKPHPGRLSRLNVAALAVNLGFSLLHVLQTQLWYDGLAQDVPVWSSQWSVIIMLVIVLYQMAPVRGLVLGKRVAWDARALRWSGKWHGLYIAWALVYTFWFHPTEGDFGLLVGFLYMFLLLTQLSFANTEIHFSGPWVAALELMVGVHGPLIAIQKALSGEGGDSFGPGIWIMFASGFLFMFVFTGQYSLRLPKWARAAIFAAYAAMLAGLYAWRGFGKLYEVLFIPVALYGGALVLALVARLATLGKPKNTA